MSAIDVATPTRRASERRAAAQPYPRRRPRRSQRLGNPTDDETNDHDVDEDNENEDIDDDALLNGTARRPHEESTAAARGGLFSRLFSFFPLGGSKKPNAFTDAVEEVKHDDVMDASMASTSDQEDDKAEQETSQETSQESLDTMLEVAVKSPVAESAVSNGHTQSPVKITRSPPSKRSSPKTKAAEKKRTSPATVSSVFGHGAEKTKSLKIGSTNGDKEPFAFQRVTGRRRNKPSSPRVAESPLAVIKKRKPISYEEYERLSTQLRNLVEATPENALALTRSTLSNALESSGTSDVPATQETGRDRRELSVAALPSVKRARPSEDLPISLPREDRLTRKPKPSRLLTGTKRDAASRSAYSAAVAEKILSTLNKIQTPLDNESQKPTPSTSLSWAKYQLALTNQESSPQGEDADMDADDQIAPPTMSVPKVAWKPAVVDKSTKMAPDMAKTSVFSFPQPTAVVQKQSTAHAGKTSFSENEASPAATVKSKTSTQDATVTVPASTLKQRMGQFDFTLPESTSSLPKPTGDDSIQFFFTPPPALREPPKRSPGQKMLTAKSAVATAPFSFMPSSPRVRPESLTKSVPPKAKASEQGAAPVSSEKAAPSAIATNPLARFMQVDVNSWRCPTCAVTNGVQLTKCPCCETAKPSTASSSGDVGTTAAPVSSTSAGANPLARFMQMEPGSWKCPSCAVTNGVKYTKCPCCDTAKPGDAPTGNVKARESSSAATPAMKSSGFTFGVSSGESKKTDSVASASGGFTFNSETQKSAATTNSSGFSFGVSAQSSTTPAPPSSGFTFGVNADSKTASSSAKPSAGFTFSAPITAPVESTSTSNKRKTSDDGVREGSGKKPASAASTASPTPTTTGGFTFGVAAAPASKASTSALGSAEADKPKPASFAFGSNSSAPDMSQTQASFTFGSSSDGVPAKASVPSFLSSSSLANSNVAGEKKDGATSKFGVSEEKKDVPLFTFGASSAKPIETKPADSSPSFTFGASTVKPTESKAADSKPSFPVGTAAVIEPKSADLTPPKVSFGFTPIEAPGSTEKKAAFSFGGSSTSANTQTMSAAVSKPAFEFGSSTGASKPPMPFGSGTPTTSRSNTPTPPPAFAFGAASSDNSVKKTEAPVFSFGGGSSSGGASAAFGSAPSSAGFGASSTSFSSGPSASTGFGLATSSGFALATTAPASTGFGSTISSGFGATTSSGFGTTTSASFGPTSTSTSFGTTPTTTPSFGTTPASTPGAPAFSFGGSTPAPAASQPGFSFNAPTSSSAFTTPTTSAFGSTGQNSGFGSTPASGGFGSTAPASGFGMNSAQPFGSTPAPSPAFGVSGNGSGFGGNTFGSNAPASGGFGATTPTPPAAFGGSSSNFGTPSNSFGAPANAFGAAHSSTSSGFRSTPSPVFGAPATPAFGAPPTPGFGAPSAGFGSTPAFGGQQQPASDGFNMGAAPPKRRILKAKTRTKRT